MSLIRLTQDHPISREYPLVPLMGVGALILDRDRIVMVRRGEQPSKGEWSIPGGLVRVGETLREAVIREAREETGLDVEPEELVELLERIFHDEQGRVQYHYVLADFRCKVRSGTLVAGSDAAEAAWVSREDLDDLRVAAVTMKVIRKALEERGDG